MQCKKKGRDRKPDNQQSAAIRCSSAIDLSRLSISRMHSESKCGGLDGRDGGMNARRRKCDREVFNPV
jgi:hypothetical protein